MNLQRRSEALVGTLTPRRITWLLGGAAILMLAFYLRWSTLGAESIWIDEAYSMVLAAHSPAEIIQGTAADQHPPFYYLLLSGWMSYGSGIEFARALSMLLGVINVWQVLLLGKSLGNEWVGLGSGLLVAFSPAHIWYSQEIRMYILLLVLTTAATSFLWDSLRGKNRWVLYGIFSFLALMTQYFAVFVFLAHGLIVLIWAWKDAAWHNFVRWTAALGVVFVVFTIWIPTFLVQLRDHSMPWIGTPSAGDIRDVAVRMILGDRPTLLPVIARWSLVLGLGLILVWGFARMLKRYPEGIEPIFFSGIWCLVPFLAISVMAFIIPIFQFKQYIFLLAPLALLITLLLVELPPWAGGITYAALILTAGISLNIQQTTLTKDDWRGATRHLEANFQEGDLVFGNPAANSLPLTLLLDEPLPYQGYPTDYDILTGGWEGEILDTATSAMIFNELASQHQRIWLVEFGPQFWDPTRTIEDWLGQNGALAEDIQFGRIRIRLYRLQGSGLSQSQHPVSVINLSRGWKAMG